MASLPAAAVATPTVTAAVATLTADDRIAAVLAANQRLINAIAARDWDAYVCVNARGCSSLH